MTNSNQRVKVVTNHICTDLRSCPCASVAASTHAASTAIDKVAGDDVQYMVLTENLESHAEQCLMISIACNWTGKYDITKWRWMLQNTDRLTVAVHEGSWIGVLLIKDFSSISFIGPQVWQHIGMVLVKPEFHNRSVGKTILLDYNDSNFSEGRISVGSVTTTEGLGAYTAVGCQPVQPFLHSIRRVSALCSVASMLPIGNIDTQFNRPGPELKEIVALDSNVFGLNRESVLVSAAERAGSFTVTARRSNGRIMGGLLGWQDSQTKEYVLGPILGTDETALALVATAARELPQDTSIAFAVRDRPHVLEQLRADGFKVSVKADHGSMVKGPMPHRDEQYYFAPLNFYHG